MTVSAPVELTSRSQWVGWQLLTREGKPTKVPVNCHNGSNASTTDPRTWCSFDQALAFVEAERLDGIGYVLSPDDPYTGVDLDHCRNADTGQIEEWAAVIAYRLDSYTEISPSGTGLRIFVRGALPPHGRRKGHIEVYSQARFLTITGNVLPDVPERIEDRQEELSQWHLEVFGPPPSERASSTAVARLPIQLADADLLKKARSADNGEKFWALWNGDWSSSYGSQSEADLALVSHLAFYTGPDETRLDTLFRSSGLMREKWDRSGYRNSTINKALDGRTEFYGNGNLALAPRLNVNGMVHTSAGMVDTATGEVVDEDPWMGMGDLIRMEDDAELQIVAGLLWDKHKHWLYSSVGAGKTMLSLAIGMHVAMGVPFCGRDVVQGGVYLLEEDQSKGLIRKYVRMLNEVYEFDVDELHRNFRMNRLRGNRLADAEGLAKVKAMLIKGIQSGVPPRLLILDACERLVPSEKWSTKELAQLGELLDWCVDNGMTTVVIDHTRKQANGGKSDEKPDPISMLYGGMNKGAIADVMMYLTGSIKTTATLSFPKIRDEEQADIHIKFSSGEGFNLKQGKKRLDDTEQLIQSVLNEASRTHKHLTSAEAAAATELSQRTAQRVLSDLVKAGYAEEFGAGRTTTYGVGAPSTGMFS